MADAVMLTVFCYDISRASVRRRVSAVLEAEGVRVQGSVFEARLPRRIARRVARQAAALLEDGDSLRVYVVGADGLRRCETFGWGPPVLDGAAYTLL